MLCTQNAYTVPQNIATVCAGLLEKFGKAETDGCGNVLCKVGEHRPERKTLLLNAHIDEIAMIVTHIDESGFLKVGKCGGIDVRVLPASRVTIFHNDGKTTSKYYGVLTSVPPHLQTDSSKAAKLDDLFIDTGLGKKAKELISQGDMVLIENRPLEMGSLVTAKALDDRACVMAVLLALEKLVGKETAYNIEVLFSSGEELGSRGAKPGAFKSNADLALIFDVTFGRVHGESDDEYCAIGGGAAIGVSPVLSRELTNALTKTAENAGLPYQTEVMGGGTGTDADAIAVTKGGIPSCTVSIPIKYMHTPVEAVDMNDVENTAALTALFCEGGDTVANR